MKTITLSGWGQPFDVLQEICPGSVVVDYADYTTITQALEAIAEQGKECDLVIGWSLGGQLAVRAVAAGLLKPKALILIAAPFQFVARPERKLGMSANLYRTFRDNYVANPARTLERAWASIVKGDACAADIRHHLERQDKHAVLQKNWLHWLDMLQAFSCAELYLGDFPPTMLVHGDQDAVVYPEQSLAFLQAIPQAKLLTLENCGHAPHWNSPALIQQIITEFAHG